MYPNNAVPGVPFFDRIRQRIPILLTGIVGDPHREVTRRRLRELRELLHRAERIEPPVRIVRAPGTLS
jgi:hypothetical protein